MSTQIPTDFHGSDIDAVAQYFHINPQDMVSFAANVNPLGISTKLREELTNHIDVISSYPERDYHTLRQAIGTYVKAEPEHILVGNGSTELIGGVVKAVCPKDALLIAPSYSEYEREVGLCGGHLRYYPLSYHNQFQLDISNLQTYLNSDTDLLIICNPNNPTASALTTKELSQILDICRNKNIVVMIDETYIEFSNQQELIEAIPLTQTYENLVVLRGISKFFAAPGLRLGYAVCSNKQLRDTINTSKDPWTINSLAAKAGEIMFADSEYCKHTKQYILNEKEKMIHAFEPLDCIKIYPSQTNFLLMELINTDKTATEVFAYCAKQGLMIRDCTSFPYLGEKFIRICMMSESDNLRLITAIKELLS